MEQKEKYMSHDFLKMTDLDLANKRVLIREDLNVPLDDGIITSDARIERAIPTIKAAMSAGAKVLVLSHLGRPTEGRFEQQYSLAPVAEKLSVKLGQPVTLMDDWLENMDVASGQVVLAENVRFNEGETANDAQLAKLMASQCDVFVMDAFATAHRKQASTYGVAEFAPLACAGPLLVEEIDALSKALNQPLRPLVAIVGGSKVSTKIQLLDAMLTKVNCLLVGGGIANTFLAAMGFAIGKSLYEASWVDEAKRILEKAAELGVEIPLPVDVLVGKEFAKEAVATVKSAGAVADDDMILDVGPKTAASYQSLMAGAGTIVWNGPVGVFEFPQFSQGTEALAKAVAQSPAFSIAGGGDTLAALDVFGVADKVSYVSTGGGAFLSYLEDNELPAIAVLKGKK